MICIYCKHIKSLVSVILSEESKLLNHWQVGYYRMSPIFWSLIASDYLVFVCLLYAIAGVCYTSFTSS